MQLDTKHNKSINREVELGHTKTSSQAHLVVAHKGVHEVFSVGRQTHQHGYHSNPYTEITSIRIVYQTMIRLI